MRICLYLVPMRYWLSLNLTIGMRSLRHSSSSSIDMRSMKLWKVVKPSSSSSSIWSCSTVSKGASSYFYLSLDLIIVLLRCAILTVLLYFSMNSLNSPFSLMSTLSSVLFWSWGCLSAKPKAASNSLVASLSDRLLLSAWSWLLSSSGVSPERFRVGILTSNFGSLVSGTSDDSAFISPVGVSRPTVSSMMPDGISTSSWVSP